jgi:hypothetical protein
VCYRSLRVRMSGPAVAVMADPELSRIDRLLLSLPLHANRCGTLRRKLPE